MFPNQVCFFKHRRTERHRHRCMHAHTIRLILAGILKAECGWSMQVVLIRTWLLWIYIVIQSKSEKAAGPYTFNQSWSLIYKQRGIFFEGLPDLFWNIKQVLSYHYSTVIVPCFLLAVLKCLNIILNFDFSETMKRNHRILRCFLAK